MVVHPRVVMSDAAEESNLGESLLLEQVETRSTNKLSKLLKTLHGLQKYVLCECSIHATISVRVAFPWRLVFAWWSSQGASTLELDRGADIVVVTPGCLNDILGRREVREIDADLLVNPVQVVIGIVDELVANKPYLTRLRQILRSEEPRSKILLLTDRCAICFSDT
ncbi:hypothetical protein LguiB_008705 [Lonicera macranthoides]